MAMTVSKLIALGALAQRLYDMQPGVEVQILHPGESGREKRIRVSNGPRVVGSPPTETYAPVASEFDVVQLDPFADAQFADNENQATLVWAGYSKKLNILCVEIGNVEPWPGK